MASRTPLRLSIRRIRRIFVGGKGAHFGAWRARLDIGHCHHEEQIEAERPDNEEFGGFEVTAGLSPAAKNA
jgi:hypothetical protein